MLVVIGKKNYPAISYDIFTKEMAKKMDEQLFDETSIKCSKIITESYSTSFTFGIKTLDKKFHSPIYCIYGFVRFADEIVDTFFNKNRQALLNKLKKDTHEAIESKISLNPVLHSFQLVVNEYKIGLDLIDAFLRSMEMDLTFTEYTDAEYRVYIYGSAQVVGLMCLKVFCEGDESMYQKLKSSACSLGAAFQKVNFLRDIKSDFQDRNRVYFPGVKFHQLDDAAKKSIEDDIEKDFIDCWSGMEQLPDGAKSGVKIAYLYFKKLLYKIKSLPPEVILQKRVSISTYQKLVLFLNSFSYLILNLLIILFPVILTCDVRVSYYAKLHAVFPAIVIPAIFFIIWDVWFTKMMVWKFNARYTLGKTVHNLPIEECFFFFTVPYACLFIHESFYYLLPTDFFQPFVNSIIYVLIPLFLGIGLLNLERRYTSVNFLVAAVTLGLHFLVFGDKYLGRISLSYLVHLFPFLVCNGFLTGGGPTDEPIVIYNNDHNLAIRVGTIPIEDFVYSMTLLLMNATIFEVLK